jgi:hypothetical protein
MQFLEFSKKSSLEKKQFSTRCYLSIALEQTISDGLTNLLFFYHNFLGFPPIFGKKWRFS